jgi:DNA-binding transcriptional MerR regulator
LAELRFVRRCKDLGFRLRDIAVLAQLRREPASTRSCDRVHEELSRLSERLDIERREVEYRLVSVRSLLTACAGGRPLTECPAFASIDALDPPPPQHQPHHP